MSVMNCSQVRDDLVSFLDGEMPESEAQSIRTHLAGCESCAVIAERHRAAADLLGEYEGIEPREERTLAILAAAAEIDREPPARPRRWRVARILPYSSAAALLIAALWIGSRVWPTNGGGTSNPAPAPVDAEVQEIASNLDLYLNLDDLLSPESGTLLDLLASDLDLDNNDEDRDN